MAVKRRKGQGWKSARGEKIKFIPGFSTCLSPNLTPSFLYGKQTLKSVELTAGQSTLLLCKAGGVSVPQTGGEYCGVRSEKKFHPPQNLLISHASCERGQHYKCYCVLLYSQITVQTIQRHTEHSGTCMTFFKKMRSHNRCIVLQLAFSECCIAWAATICMCVWFINTYIFQICIFRSISLISFFLCYADLKLWKR